jgi:hypothetical protein
VILGVSPFDFLVSTLHKLPFMPTAKLATLRAELILHPEQLPSSRVCEFSTNTHALLREVFRSQIAVLGSLLPRIPTHPTSNVVGKSCTKYCVLRIHLLVRSNRWCADHQLSRRSAAQVSTPCWSLAYLFYPHNLTIACTGRRADGMHRSCARCSGQPTSDMALRRTLSRK